MDALHVGHAAARTGWSARMLRYLEQAGLVVPSRTPAGYRLYGLRELNQLRSLAELRRALRPRDRRHRLRRAAAPGARAARGDRRLARRRPTTRSWVDWEQRKHERLLAA